MKPNEILGMVEEACGTRLYEMKKVQAQKTMEKKDIKVSEITKILEEGASWRWVRCRHHADAGEAEGPAQCVSSVGVELDRDRATASSGDRVRVLQCARDAARRRRGKSADRRGAESGEQCESTESRRCGVVTSRIGRRRSRRR